MLPVVMMLPHTFSPPTSALTMFLSHTQILLTVCPPGTALNGTRCDECPPNSVSPGGKPSATKCKVCPPPLIANEAGTKCIKRPPQCGSAVCGTVSGAYCGACPTGQTCANGLCKDDSSTGQGGCTPLLCDPGRLCGSQPDGCGGTANCGTCPPGEQCVSTPNGGAVCQGTTPPCTPLTACDAGRACGSQPDGCGGTLDCGTCPQGQQCVSNSTAAVCETPCTPLTACDAGRACGSQPDGCGGTLDCGTCPQGQQCVSNSTAAVCETSCTPLTACDAGRACGSQPDGCGGTLDCGTCPQGQQCVSNSTAAVCETPCTPLTACDAGRLCGSQPDGCGGTLNCGTCPQGQPCVSNSTAAVCETPCTPLLSPCTVDSDCCGCGITLGFKFLGLVWFTQEQDTFSGGRVFCLACRAGAPYLWCSARAAAAAAAAAPTRAGA
jgi:hypothetical protein